MQHERNFDFHTDDTLPISGASSWSTSWRSIASARPGSPRRPLLRVCLQAARSISMTAISVAGFAAVAFVPHVSLGDAPRRPRRSHATVRCKLAFLEGLYSASAGTAQKSASPRVSKLPFARRVSEQSISSSPAARGKGAITVCG